MPARNRRASYYGPGFNGRQTASGHVFQQGELTAAHRSWRFGTKVRVTNLRNGRAVVVTITDRGPYVRGRGLDLSAGAARALDVTGSGVVPVRLDPLCALAPVKARS
jgi:rare lipoprotein A